MCALVTFTSLTTLAAASVILLVLNTSSGKLFNSNTISEMQTNGSTNYSALLDSKGPKVQFILFTRGNEPFNLKINDSSGLERSGYNMSNPTKIIIHGFQSGIKEDIFVVNKNAYLDSGDYNVIGMDWSVLCNFEYFTATREVRNAGKFLARFLDWLSEFGVKLDNVHLVGHSLGAHVAGIAGNEVTKGKIGRITGLDPAAPGFRTVKNELKLDSNDANIVDVIHTYIKVLSLSEPMGHIDFYPNGGRWQPGCPDIYDIWNVSESLVCNHARAYYFFAESIRNRRAFRSFRCNSVEDALNSRCFQFTNVYMGQAETYKFGLYYLRTRANKPYTMSNR